MNAVGTVSNADPGILAAFTTTATPAPSQNGFNSLISALLGPQRPAPVDDSTSLTSNTASNNQDSGTTSVSMPMRSSSEIADAMIRSILGNPLAAGNLFSDQSGTPATTLKGRFGSKDNEQPAPAQPSPTDGSNLAPASLPLVPVPAAPVPPQTPFVPQTPFLMTSPDAAPATTAGNSGSSLMLAAAQGRTLSNTLDTLAKNTPGNASGNGAGNASTGSPQSQTNAQGNGPVIPIEPRPASGKAEVAFALRLTPMDAHAPAPHVAAPPTAPAKAPLPETPAPLVPAAPAQAAPAPTQENTPATPALANASAYSTVDNAPPQQNSGAQADAGSQSNSGSPSKDNTPSNASHPLISENKSRPQAEQNAETAPAVAAASASSDRGGSPSNAQPAPAVLRAVQPTPAEPIRTAEQALRAAEPSAPAETAPKSGAAQEIAVRISGPDSQAVDLHMIERGGQVQVTVRTPDSGLQSSLRQDLGTLVNSLERSGYRAETLPLREASFAAASGMNSVATPNSGGASFMDARNHFQDSQNGGQQHAGQNGRGGSQQDSSHGQSNNSGGQQQKRRPQFTWIDTLENAQ